MIHHGYDPEYGGEYCMEVCYKRVDMDVGQVVIWYPSNLENDVGQGEPETTRQLLRASCSILFPKPV